MRKESGIRGKTLREKAIDILKSNGLEVSAETEALKLLHELSVHQIELELQNEELLKAKQETNELAEKYTELYDFAPTGYLTLTQEARIAELNLAAARMLGRERNRLINASFDYFLAASSRPVFRTFFRSVFEENNPISCEVILNDGKCFHLQGNTVSNQCALIATDITEIRKAEKEREILVNELREAREKLDLAMDKAGIGRWEMDYENKIIKTDDRLSRILGLDSSNKISFANFLGIIHKEDSERVRNEFSDSFRNKIPLDTVFRINTKDNSIKYLNIKGFVRYGKENELSGLSGLCSDITRIYETTEKSIIRLNEKLLRSNSDLENFAYVASHDLQEPLRMISSFLQLLEKQYGNKLDEAAHEYITYAVDGAKRMYELLNSLLTYSRIQTKGGRFECVDLNEVMDIVQQNIQFHIRENAATIKSAKLPTVFADRSQMIQLFQNLIENGIKFSTTAPLISVSAGYEKGYHVISVSDNGIGIDKIYFERIFRIFQRLHSPGEYAGTGIGLSVCKRIVERHGGSIWVESEPGAGTTFFFSIPVKKDNAES